MKFENVETVKKLTKYKRIVIWIENGEERKKIDTLNCAKCSVAKESWWVVNCHVICCDQFLSNLCKPGSIKKTAFPKQDQKLDDT